VETNFETSNAFFGHLDTKVAAAFAELRRARFWRHIKTHGWTLPLYQRCLVELAHLTAHTPVTLGLAASREHALNRDLLKYCFAHGAEELYHDQLAHNDLCSTGFSDHTLSRTVALPATQALIAYLYYSSLHLGAMARMAYSYWGETFTAQVGELLVQAESQLGLRPNQMTFFRTHQDADPGHANEVREIVQKYTVTEADRMTVGQALDTTLYLMLQVLDGIVETTACAQRQE
jgi:hypothetical protein